MSRHIKTKSAFTMLELALAMAFISFLLLGIGIITTNVAVLYQKGIAIKSVNANGRELIDEFSRAISATSYTMYTNFNDIYIYNTGQVLLNGESDPSKAKTLPIHGAFCTGLYSYIWNTGYSLKENNNLRGSTDRFYATYGSYTGTTNGVSNYTDYMGTFHLLRVDDVGRSVCLNYSGGNHYVGGTNPVELLSNSEDNLVLYDMVVFPPTYHSSSGHALFSGTFILGTLQGEADITTIEDICGLPTGMNFNTDFEFCSINKFNFAMRATGDSRL